MVENCFRKLTILLNGIETVKQNIINLLRKIVLLKYFSNDISKNKKIKNNRK